MKYIAHVAIRLSNEIPDCQKEEWSCIGRNNDIEYRWRFCHDLTYEVICGLYSNKYAALYKAKQMYVSLLYWMLRDGISIEEAGCEEYYPRFFNEKLDGTLEEYLDKELFFFWSKDNPGGRLGPGVYEVSESMDEFSEYNLNEINWSVTLGNVDLGLHTIDEYIFMYSKEAQEYLKTVILAEKATNLGMKMTIYCGLLEHLSEDGYKEPAVIEQIDRLIQIVHDSSLPMKDKNTLQTYLGNGKRLSARQKCISLCEKYCRRSYRGYSAKQVFEDAYSLRSKFSHGGTGSSVKLRPALFMKHVVLDIIREIMLEKERNLRQGDASFVLL